MGRNKPRNKGRKKTSSSSTSVPAAAVTSPSLTTVSLTALTAAGPQLPPEVNEDLILAVKHSNLAFTLGKDEQGMEVMDKACNKHRSYAMAHILRAHFYVSLAGSTKDRTKRLRYAGIAASANGQASSLSPTNPFYRRIHAAGLYDIAGLTSKAEDYDRVIKVCNLSLELPVTYFMDPAKDHGSGMFQLCTAETRIQHCLQMIRYLRKNSICCKNRSLEDDRPQFSSSSSSKMKQKGNRQTGSASAVSKTKALDFLTSLSTEDRLAMKLYSVSVPELLEAGRRQKVDALTLEALSVAAGGHPIKGFPCCYCHIVPVATAEEHIAHICEAHVGNLVQGLKEVMPEKSDKELEAVLPDNASSDWTETADIFGWSPLDDPSVQPTPSPERRKLLDEIGKTFHKLVEFGILTPRHLDYIIELTMPHILGLHSSSELLSSGVTETNECIRYMLAPQLEKILSFLNDLWESSEVEEEIKKEGSENLDDGEENGKFPWLFLDHNWLILDFSEDNPKALVDWLYDDSNDEVDQKVVWMKTLSKSRLLIEKLQIEFALLSLLCEEKLKSLDAVASLANLQSVENISIDRLTKHRELLGSFNSIELVAISEIIESAQQNTDDVDKLIGQKISELKIQLCRIDAMIMGTQGKMDMFEDDIEEASVYDYQFTLMKFVKSFVKMRLEDCIYKDAIKKSDALMKELLGEAYEGVQTNKGGEHSKKGKGKGKAKRTKR